MILTLILKKSYRYLIVISLLQYFLQRCRQPTMVHRMLIPAVMKVNPQPVNSQIRIIQKIVTRPIRKLLLYRISHRRKILKYQKEIICHYHRLIIHLSIVRNQLMKVKHHQLMVVAPIEGQEVRGVCPKVAMKKIIESSQVRFHCFSNLN